MTQTLNFDESSNLTISSKNLFIATGCSSRPNVVEWCPLTSQIIFAAKTDICIAHKDINVSPYYRISYTRHAHTDEITCIKMAKSRDRNLHVKNCLFCTSSNNGELAIWSNKNDKKIFRKITTVKRSSAINMARMYVFGNNLDKFLIVTAEIDKLTSQYYMEQTGAITSLNSSTMEFNGKIITSFDLIDLDNLLILTVGLSDGNIEIFYSCLEGFSPFISAMTLLIQPNAWIRALAFEMVGDELFLASTFDNIIKLWVLNEQKLRQPAEQELKLTPKIFKATNRDVERHIAFSPDSTLTAHEGFIQTLNWHPTRKEFLSSGADKKVIRWQYSDEQSLWLPISQFGEFGEDIVDYYDAMYSPDGSLILYHSLFGAFYLWEIDNENFIPKSHTIGGHLNSISDISWDPYGSYLLSCSLDKTTRLYTFLKNGEYFFEIARPQLHGHSLNCIATISRSVFVSGGEEKIFRVFQANSSFAKNMTTLTEMGFETKDLPSVAFQSELSLTNKPILTNEEGLAEFTEPPREDQLNKYTLFPEINKLYGHGFEVFAVASNHAGTVIATSCKASHPEHATIFLWETSTWQQKRILKAHQLTVTQMEFSKNDQFLLSTSRDRTWTLFRLKDNASSPFDYSIYYQTTAKTSKHSRIIWSCAWSHDSFLFVTTSRDKSLNIWSVDDQNKGGEGAENYVKHILNFGFEDSVTAIDFGPNKLFSSKYLLASGLDNGKVLILYACIATSKCSVISEFSKNFAHSQTITRIRFRPSSERIDEGESKSEQNYEFASSGSNNILKIYRCLFTLKNY